MLEGYTAILGGSFNPPTISHQLICFWLREALKVKAVYVVPAYQHAFGKPLESFSDRMDMCKLMAKPIKKAYVENTEFYLPKPNTTYALLEHYKTVYCLDQLVFVMGSDCLGDITKWHRWQELTGLAKILVMDRSGYNVSSPIEVIRYSLNIAPTSSTIIRDRLAAGENVEGLVPYKVSDYIYKNHLYGVK